MFSNMKYPTFWKIVALMASQAIVPTVQAAGNKTTSAGSYTVKSGDTFARIARSKGISLGELLKANRIGNPDRIVLGQRIVIPGARVSTEKTASNKPAVAKTATKTPVKAPVKQLPLVTTTKKKPVPTNTTVDVTPPAPRGAYIVKSGDTLSRINRNTGVPVSQLARLNGLTETSTLRAGQTLRLTTTANIPVAQGNPVQKARPVIREQAPVTNAIPQEDTAAIIYQQPAQPLPVAQATGTAPHTVQGGETFTSIARVYGVTSSQLAAVNKGTNPAKLRIGQTLLIPGQPVRPVAKQLPVRADGRIMAEQPNPLAADLSEDADLNLSRTRTGYLVQDGETITEIAARFRCDEKEIRQLNRMGASDTVYPGRYILVPFNRQAPLPGRYAQRNA